MILHKQTLFVDDLRFGACKYQAKCAVHVVEKACVPCTLRDVNMMHFIYDSHDAACAQC